jgi:large repetitive protein
VLSTGSRPGHRRRAVVATLGLLAIAAAAVLSAGRSATAAELPVAVGPAPVTTDEDHAVQITLSGTDADGHDLAFSIIEGPAEGDLSAIATPECAPGPPSVCTASVDYTPDPDSNGSDAFTFRVNDGVDGQSAPDEVHLTITSVNDDPVAGDDAAETSEDSQLIISKAVLLSNDTDVDLDTLAVLTFDATSEQSGTIVDNFDGTLTYTPLPDYFGPDTFGYTAGDGNGGSDTATVSLTVAPVNDEPVADNESVTGIEDQARSISVLIGDVDIDGDPLTIVDTTDGAHGTVAIIASSTRVRYTGSADFNGPDAFTYTVHDGHGGQDTATVSITLTPVNDAPTIEIPFEPVVAEDAGAQSFGGFLEGVEGPSDEVLTQEVDFAIDDVTATSLFSVQPAVNPNGTLTFTPAANANGSSIVTVHSFDTGGTANGGIDMSPSQSFTITITPVNDAPTAVDDGAPTPLAVAQNAGPTPLTVLANDSTQPDAGESLAIVAVTQGGHGAVAVTGGGSGLTYDPIGSFTGADTFTYTISDGVLEATATVHVNVAPDITPPVTSIRVIGTAARSSSTVRVTIRWSAVELQSGVTLYQLQQRIDGGAWMTIPLPTPTTTSIERVLAGGHDYEFRVRARDGIGNLGAYATSRPLRL